MIKNIGKIKCDMIYKSSIFTIWEPVMTDSTNGIYRSVCYDCKFISTKEFLEDGVRRVMENVKRFHVNHCTTINETQKEILLDELTKYL